MRVMMVVAMVAAMVVAMLAIGCGGEPVTRPDANRCAADFGICHAELQGVCFVADGRSTDAHLLTCAASFAACEPLRADAMRAAGCD